MADSPFAATLTDLDQLETLYRAPSKGAVAKETDHIDEVTAEFIAASPFCLVGTTDATGRGDVSPKGGEPGFVKVLDRKRLVIPDLNGNNRLDSIRNIIEHPHAGLLFLVPQEGATLRIKGGAWISTDDQLLDLFTEYRRPTTAICIEAESVYMHCAKCIRRSGLWEPESWANEGAPTGTDLIMSHMGMDESLRTSVDEGLEQSYVDGLAADSPR